MFPIAMNSVPVSYETSNILKVSASFNFDRYVCGKTTSYSVYSGTDNNKVGILPTVNTSPPANNQIPTQREVLVPVSAGAAGAGGVRFRRVGQTVAEAINTDTLREFYR